MQKTSKTAKTVTGTKIKFEGALITKVTFNGTKKKKKIKTICAKEYWELIWYWLDTGI